MLSCRLMSSVYCGIPRRSISTGTMCSTVTVASFCRANFAARSSALSEAESKSTGARIRLNGKPIWFPPNRLGDHPEDPEEKPRQQDRCGQREDPCHRDVSHGFELQARF